MHQSTTPSLSQTIWARCASSQFLSLPIVQTLHPVTFANSLSSQALVMRQLRRWKRVWHKRTSMGPSRSCWNGTTSALHLVRIYIYLRLHTSRMWHKAIFKSRVTSLKLEFSFLNLSFALYILYTYWDIYIYIERERERKKEIEKYIIIIFHPK